MTLEELQKRLVPWAERHRRTAYDPVVADGDGSLADSKFSGKPWLAAGEAWPRCGTCNEELQLLLQLNLGELPGDLKGAFGNGLLQVFHCVGESLCESWQPFSASHRVRIIDPAAALAGSAGEPDGHFPAKRILRWNGTVEYPYGEEADELGLKRHYDFTARTAALDWREGGIRIEPFDYEILERYDELCAATGDKLGGWPRWVQGVEYPNCPRCKTRMRHVFQIDSEDNVPYLFGDMGCGHVTQCPVHPDVVAFGWACS